LLNIVAIDTAIFPQEFNPELRLIGFLERSINFGTEFGIGPRP